MIGVYAPNCYIERRSVWEEIRNVKGLFQGHWIVCVKYKFSKFASQKELSEKKNRDEEIFIFD